MLRIRFHGRGGHGVKTASRILGTAAFLAGRQAQDSPVYGGERRGAAIAAFTRIDSKPIRERGLVVDPDLIVVADETLLADPSAGVLLGHDTASAVFVNAAGKAEALARQYEIRCPVLTLDLRARTSEWLGRGSALSAPLGAAACERTIPYRPSPAFSDAPCGVCGCGRRMCESNTCPHSGRRHSLEKTAEPGRPFPRLSGEIRPSTLLWALESMQSTSRERLAARDLLSGWVPKVKGPDQEVSLCEDQRGPMTPKRVKGQRGGDG